MGIWKTGLPQNKDYTFCHLQLVKLQQVCACYVLYIRLSLYCKLLTVLPSWSELRFHCLILSSAFEGFHRSTQETGIRAFPRLNFPGKEHPKPKPHSLSSNLAIPSLSHSFSHISITSTSTLTCAGMFRLPQYDTHKKFTLSEAGATTWQPSR